MKRILSIILSLLVLFSVSASAYAMPLSTKGSQIPLVLLGGDGDTLYDKDGNYLFQIDDLGHLVDGSDSKELLRSVANVLQPFLLQGLMFNQWDPYYEALEKEIGELSEGVRLDENGNVTNGSDISKAHRDEVRNNMTTDKKGTKGYYGFQDYRFWYDWRLDPMEIADELHAYIEGICAATGAGKVALTGRCVGCNVMLAYLAKYGYDRIYGFGLDGTSSNGGEFISEAISGKFHLDGPAIERFLTDYDELGMFQVSDFVMATVDLLVKSGAVERLTAATRATIYDKVVKGVTSALATSTFFTMPCYWGFVRAEDYDAAIYYVFGAPGSEKRTQYAGLIEKLDRYHTDVVERIPALMEGLAERNINIAIISKYGFQIVPTCESSDALADQYASVKNSSFGATTSTLYGTLPDDYIAAREAEGKGRYISPDRQVDASTCLFPDYTWFTKGARHGNWTATENELMYTVTTADRQLTIDDFDLTQFMVWDSENKTMVPMTAENCQTEYWVADASVDHPTSFLQKLKNYFSALKVWLEQLFSVLKTKLGEKAAA